MKKPITTLLLITLLPSAFAQNIGINVTGFAPAASALLDIDGATLPANAQRGLLIPRIALTATNVAAPVAAPATSLLIYNTATAGVAPNNVAPGFYYWDGAAWTRMLTGNPGWTTTGNSGTTPTANFIGTTDPADWVIKTGGSAATNERARFLSTGQLVMNNTTRGPFTNDVLSVYADATTNGTTSNIATLGAKAVNGYASGTGIALYGNNTGIAANTFAIYGITGSLTGTANTIRAEAASVNGLAVVGITNALAGTIPTATTASGLVGQANGTVLGTAQAYGVRGVINPTMTTGDARGVQGTSPSDNGSGTLGYATSAATTGFPVGVYGQSASATGVGVMGNNTMAGATALNPTGALGQVNNATGFGIDGFNASASGTAVLGEGNGLGGTYLIGGSGGAFTGSLTGTVSLATNAAAGTGLIAAGNASGFGTLLTGSGVAGSGANFGVYGNATSNAVGVAGAPARAGGYFVSGTGATQAFTYVACYEGAAVPRKVMGTGTVNTVVKNDHDEYVLFSAPEAPENLFQDLGQGELVNGHVHIELDPTFSRNILVNDQHPLRVFVQLRGDCKGVFVSNETADGFDVTELQGGVSNAPFTWSVTANRANEYLSDGTVWKYAEERFAHTQGPQKSVEQPAVHMRDRKRPTERTAGPGAVESAPR